jgi:hypothetical protein
MIGWLHPIALVGLIGIAAPILVHLLCRQRAERLSFPSVRFVMSGTTSSIRLRKSSDLGLLVLRISIVGLAAIALAEPFLISTARRDVWNRRISRAIVVDTSVATVEQASEAIAGASKGADHVVRVVGSDLKDGLLDAVDSLAATEPARREIIVISDFRHGALRSGDLADVPAGIGLQFIRIGASSARNEFRGDEALGAPGIPTRVQQIHVTPAGTELRLTTAVGHTAGLHLQAAADRAEKLLRAVAAAGAPAPVENEPIALAFQPNSTVRDTNDALTPWMLRTVVRMRRDAMLLAAARAHVRQARASDLPGVVIARDANDAPVLSASHNGSELLLLLAAASEDFLSAATLQSALKARRGLPRWNDREVVHIPASTLADWSREPLSQDSTEVRPLAPGDARVIWALVLALLSVETWVRRRGRTAVHRYADAA